MFDDVISSLCTSKVLIAMLDLISTFLWKPVASDQIYLFIAVLTKSEKQKVVINQ